MDQIFNILKGKKIFVMNGHEVKLLSVSNTITEL